MAEINKEVIKKINKFIDLLEKHNFKINQAILYGSYAKGTEDRWSDIDLAIVSDDFIGDRYSDISSLKEFIFSIDTDISPLTFRNDEFDPDNLFVKEIIRTGLRII
jgi:predicted nucleotidyltransferase